MTTGSGERVAASLANHPLFAGCGRDELDAIASIGTRIQVDPGYVLTREGRRGRELFVVESGVASCAVGGEVIKHFGPGDFFGEMGALLDTPRTATIVATTPMDVVIIDTHELSTMFLAAPAAGRRIFDKLSRTLRETQAADG